LERDLKSLKKAGFPLNMLYSLFVLHLFGEMSSSSAATSSTGRFDSSRTSATCRFPASAALWNAIQGVMKNDARHEKACKILFDDFNRDDHSHFIKRDSEYTMTSGRTLERHILSRIDKFKILPFVCQQIDAESFGGKYFDGMFPPHVYFTATPIDKEFNIYENESDPQSYRFEVTTTGNDINDPFNRICFGTHNLIVDLLKAHNIDIIDPTGDLLVYFYSYGRNNKSIK